jgi:serine/threonine protein kinase
MQKGDVLLGKFRIERVLGAGGMGLVVGARHMELDELFAMKLMHPELLSNAEAVERFVREARASARLKGEHVARVHDVGRLENGSPYMLMEHLVGDDLSGILDKRGALPVREAVDYVLQACEAIAEAHGQGIVHRDLKPANLFLTMRANGSPCIKVLDFGISKKIEANGKLAPKLTVTGALLGSPAFMSPEQMLNGKSVDMRSDIWALGAILYELTTGALPFHGETMTELVARVMDEAAKPPSSLRPEIPRAFDDVVLTCLQKRAARRYQSVEELMAALRPFVDDKFNPVKPSVSKSGLPRIDVDPDSARSTKIVNPRSVAVPVMATTHSDDSVDSESATRILKPALLVGANRRLPSAVDTEFHTTNEHTIEMTTHVQQINLARSTPMLAQVDRPGRNSSGLSRSVFLGIGILGGLAIIAFAIVLFDAQAPSVAEGTATNSPLVSAVLETTNSPMLVPPDSIAPTPQVASSSSAIAVTSAKTQQKSAVPSVEINRPGSTPKQPVRTIKPSLY